MNINISVERAQNDLAQLQDKLKLARHVLDEKSLHLRRLRTQNEKLANDIALLNKDSAFYREKLENYYFKIDETKQFSAKAELILKSKNEQIKNLSLNVNCSMFDEACFLNDCLTNVSPEDDSAQNVAQEKLDLNQIIEENNQNILKYF